jgi:Domain of unknown function (DUF4177)
MQKWEYMWIHVASEKGKQTFVANGEPLNVQTYRDALNHVGKDGWELVAAIPPTALSSSSSIAEFCLKRPIQD